jgi:RimJ/RimL family protein N-acetyltransferase
VIPRLETARLLLREWRLEDFGPLAEIMADADVARYLSGAPLTRAEAWRSLAGCAGHWSLRGYGMWAVERKSDHALLGRVGLHYPEGWPGEEVGWTLGKPFWGNGYATEAARAAINYGFLTQPVSQLISVIDPDNLASQAVARRLGEARGERSEVIVAGKAYAVDIWSISRKSWANAGASGNLP